MQSQPVEEGNYTLSLDMCGKARNVNLAFQKIEPEDLLKLFYNSNPQFIEDVQYEWVTDTILEVSGRFVHLGKSIGVPLRFFIKHYSLHSEGGTHSFTLSSRPKDRAPRQFPGAQEVIYSHASISFSLVEKGELLFKCAFAFRLPVPLPKVLSWAPKMLLKKGCRRFLTILERWDGELVDKIEHHDELPLHCHS
jgi:hypothetical protein